MTPNFPNKVALSKRKNMRNFFEIDVFNLKYVLVYLELIPIKKNFEKQLFCHFLDLWLIFFQKTAMSLKTHGVRSKSGHKCSELVRCVVPRFSILELSSITLFQYTLCPTHRSSSEHNYLFCTQVFFLNINE